MPPINLSKGGKINLTKSNPINLAKKESLDFLHIGLGWDVKQGGGDNLDLDAMAVSINTDGKANPKYACNFSQLSTPDKAIHHLGDNLTGEGEGDDEVMQVYLSRLPQEIAEVHFRVVIYQAATRGQHFGQVSNAFIRLVDMSTRTELCRYTLGNEFSLASAVSMGFVRRQASGEWEFEAEGAVIASIRADQVREPSSCLVC